MIKNRFFTMAMTLILASTSLIVFSQVEEQRKQEAERASLVNTRVDNNGYWKLKASQGLARLNPMQNIPPAVYTGSAIRALSVITEDSPDVPVAPSNTTQSETSIFVNPGDNGRVLNSNNSSANPMTSFYGADALLSEDAGLTWGGTVQGPAGGNSGDPVALIGNNGWYYVNYINNSYGQSVDYSQDGGNTWTRVNIASASGGLLDKNHMWIDNATTSPYDGHMYNAWTDFGALYDNEIGLSFSSDEGLSWSPVKNVSAAVNAGSHNQGVNITTGPNGEVYAIWAIYDGWPTDETAIGMARSFDGGATFEPAERIITNIRGIRSSGVNKNMRVNSFPVVTADISGGDYNGNLYVVWCNIGVPGVNTGSDADVYFVRSEDQGENWSDPVRVNQDPSGLGSKHYFPWITCDPETGILSVVFYDDRNVGGNQCEVYCANSYDGGETWEDFKVSDVAFTPTPIAGLAQGYMGDYIGINARGGVVYPVWADTRSGSVMSYVSPFETNPLARPTNLTGEVTFETGTVDLNWKFEEEPGFTYFKIFRDGDSIATATDTLYQDLLPDYGIYNYRVTAYFEGMGESNPTNTSVQWGNAHISVTPDSISEVVMADSSVTRHLTVINTGQLEMQYELTPMILTQGRDGKNRDYCEASNGCDEYIGRVVVGDIDNSSNCTGYGDYTDLTTVMMAGNDYEITVVNGNPLWAADQCGAWIDWNQDEEFSPEESISMNGSPGVGPYTATITPPGNALPGPTRMRIRIVYSETPEPCGYSSYGETEDYTISVVNWLSVDTYAANVMPGDTSEIGVTLDAGGMEIGNYMAELRITSNDPDTPLVVVPVTMKVRDIALAVSASPDTICQADSVQLYSEVTGGSGIFTYAWSSEPEGFYSEEPNPMAAPDTTTLYMLTVTDEDVQISDEVTIVVIPLPEVSLGEDLDICSGDSAMLDAGEGHTAYTWNTGDTTRYITVVEAGEYYVTVANEQGCSSSDTMMVSLLPLPVVDLGNDTLLCYYHEIELDAGNPGGSYLWSTGEITSTIVIDSAGMVAGLKSVYVDVTSADGCLSSDTINISFIECLGVNEPKETEELQVFPNPGKGLFSVVAAVDRNTRGKLMVINNNGSAVYQDENLLLEPGSRLEMNLQHLPDGVYTMQIVTSGSVFHSRIIINR